MTDRRPGAPLPLLPPLHRRFAGVALAAVVLGLGALGGPARPVAALEQSANAIRVTENQTVEKDFPPISGQEPLPALPAPLPALDTPERCRQATYCDVIPLEVMTPPTLKEADEFFVSVELAWQTASTPETPKTKSQTINDLDLYVWDDPQGDKPVQASSTQANPEKLRLWRPAKGKYSIVVFNYLGPNTGYKLTVSYKPESIVPPFESLDPGYVPPVVVPTVPESLTPPVDLSAEPFTPPPDTTAAATPPPAVETPAPPPAPLAPVAVDPDPDFSNFSDAAFDTELAAPAETDILRQREAKAVGPPKPASPGSLLFWLAVVPLVLLAGGGFWLSRKGSAVLKLR